MHIGKRNTFQCFDSDKCRAWISCQQLSSLHTYSDLATFVAQGQSLFQDKLTCRGRSHRRLSIAVRRALHAAAESTYTIQPRLPVHLLTPDFHDTRTLGPLRTTLTPLLPSSRLHRHSPGPCSRRGWFLWGAPAHP